MTEVWDRIEDVKMFSCVQNRYGRVLNLQINSARQHLKAINWERTLLLGRKKTTI